MNLSSRTWLNIVIATAVIVLAVIAFYPASKPELPPPMLQLLPLNKTDITSLAIHSHDKAVVKVNKQAEQWFMIEPVHIRASEQRVNTLLDLIKQPASTHLVVDKNNLAKFGLDSPRYGLEFNGYSMVIGDSDPIHQRRYVMAQDQVYLIEDYFSHLLLEGEGALIDHELLPAGSAIEKLQMPNLTLHKTESKWEILDANHLESDHYSQDSLQTLVDEWRYGHALSVSVLNAPYQLGEAPFIKVFLQNQTEPVTFYVERDPVHTLLIRPDLKVRYHVTRDTEQRLTRLTPKPTDAE